MFINTNTKNLNKKAITISITKQCNLSCIYCYQDWKKDECMTEEMVFKIIDFEFSNTLPEQYLEVTFHGGEPFLNFNVIKNVVEHYKKTDKIKRMLFFSTTNGTLVHGKIKEWLSINKDIYWCCLSLDGTKKMHDINRSSSFSNIDIDFFHLNWPTQEVKMTISKSSLPYLSEGIKYIHNKGFNINCNLAYGIDWSDENNQLILEKELTELIRYYLENDSIKPCSMLSMKIDNLGLNNSLPKMCGVGTMKSYSADGTMYPCHYFEPVSLGEEFKFDVNFLNNDSFIDQECKKCTLLSACPTCYGSNYKSTGHINIRDENMCKLNKISIYATALLHIKKIKKLGLDNIGLDSVEQKLLALGINKVYNHFNN